MLGWILKLVLIWLVLRAILQVVRGVLEGMRGTTRKKPEAVALVRDPVCGVFVAPAGAPSFGTGSQMRFFCSENCRRIYQMKFAR